MRHGFFSVSLSLRTPAPIIAVYSHLKADNSVADLCLRSLWTHCLHVWCEIPVSKTQEGCPGLDRGRGGRQMVAEVCDGGRKGGGDVEVRCLF